MIYLTADSHLGHDNIIKYAKRPFSSCEEMDKVIISRWNEIVRKDDLVYHLGDFSFKDPSYYLDKLNGNKILIKGNHDYKRIRKDNIEQFPNKF